MSLKGKNLFVNLMKKLVFNFFIFIYAYIVLFNESMNSSTAIENEIVLIL